MKAKDLKNSILQLAIQGKLVPQDPKDEPASKLLEKIRAAKQKLVKEGKIKKDKQESFIYKGDDNNYYEKIGTEVRNITGEIPFKIPDSWEWVRLGNIGEWRAGSTPSRQNAKYYNGSIPWLKTGDLNDGYITNVEETITELATEHTSAKVRPVGSVLMAMYGATIGKLGILSIPCATNQACCACIPFSGIFNKFLFFYLSAQRKNFIEQGAGGAQPNISREKIIINLFPLPPLEEQKRIVKKIESLEPFIDDYDKVETELSALNEIFPEQIKKSILQYAIQGKLVPQDPKDEPASALLEKIKAEKQKLIKAGKIKKDKQESYIYKRDNRHYEKMGDKEVDITDKIPFEIPDSWAWARLGHIGFSRIGLTYKPQDICEEGTPVLRSGNIQNGEIILNNMVHVNCEVSHNLLVKNGDILICVRNGSKSLVGKNAIINSINVGEKMSFGAFMAIFRSKLNEYIKIYLDSALFKTMLKSTKTETINQITQSNLNQALIPIPPYTEQKRIVEKIEQLFKTLS